jgi:hypothetical protein
LKIEEVWGDYSLLKIMSNVIQFIRNDNLTGRDLFFLPLNSSNDIPETIKLSSENFVCFIAWDSQKSSVEEISKLLEIIIKNGAAYICSWGPDCGRVHDIADEIDSYPFKEFGSPEDSVIMTTDHQSESLEEAMFFFLSTTSPDEYYEKSCNSSLAISIGNKDWNESIKKILENPYLVRS